VIRHHVVGAIELQAVPSRYPRGDSRLARTAPTADPVDLTKPIPKRSLIRSLIRSHALNMALRSINAIASHHQPVTVHC